MPQPLSDEELRVLQILVVHHKSIVYGEITGWMIDMMVVDEMVHHICLDHTLVTSLKDKGLIKRELNAMGKPHYVLSEDNEYQDVITEMKVRKALGVEEDIFKDVHNPNLKPTRPIKLGSPRKKSQ